ncbi:MAG: thioredoxin-disulfide reductase [Erysipelotrichaceae bacterium]|nr:thioredoxin-disulfide reductase [Erysipelotrichaceae bacterium]
MDKRYDVIIIGAGPAGMTAGIYAKRAGLDVAMLENAAPGGKMVKTFEIENFPSFTNINGADLSYKMYEQTQALGVDYLYGDVIDVIDGDIKTIITDDGNEYKANVVIVATGTKERLLGIPGEVEFTSRGVSYCAVCDGAFFKNKTVVVIGGGNSALEESLYLTQFAKKVYIVIRRDVFRADDIAQDKVCSNPKIEIIRKHIPIEIIGDSKVTSIVLENVDTKERTTLETDGIFPYIGADPNTSFISSLGITDEAGYVVVNKEMETSLPGIYGAGDCNIKTLRQIVTATSDGAIAAQNAFHYIKG